jgi:hypothetical protein
VLGVAMVASSVAQVYSVNAVGYVNTVLPPGLSLISNPLLAPVNDLDHVFSVPGGTQVYMFNGVGFDTYLFDDIDGWVKGGVPAGTTAFNPGFGAFVRNNATTPVTNTFVGDVIQGTAVTVDLPPGGLGIRSSKVPMTGKISTDLKFPLIGGTQVYVYNGTGYDTYLYDDIDGWVKSGAPNEPTINVGQAFWVRMPAGNTQNWVRSFSVN